MGTLRKRHSERVKSKVAFEAVKGDKTIAEIGREFGIHPMQVSSWKRILLEGAPELFRDGRERVDVGQKELVDRLYQQIGQLQFELDWVKKKSSFIG